MSKRYEERRKYRIGGFEYLLDDDDLAAWIKAKQTMAAGMNGGNSR